MFNPTSRLTILDLLQSQAQMKLFDPDLDFLGSKPLSPTFIHSKKSLLVVGADTGNILLDPGTFSRGFDLDNELDNNLPC